jgi:hypothetical protein
MGLDEPSDGEMGASIVSSHPFINDTCLYGRCEHNDCGLAESSHVATDTPYMTPPDQPYRCPHCVSLDRDPCPHGRAGALGLDAAPLGTPS